MTETHVAELKLRRLFAGELSGDDAESARSHMGACADCRAKLREIEEEQAKFEQEISFERFKAGVEHAGRAPVGAPRTPLGMMLIAAAAALFVFAIPQAIGLLGPHRNRTMGGPTVEMVVAPANDNSAQRKNTTAVPELLAPGDRVRIGYEAGEYPYVAIVSVDEAGEVTPLLADNLAGTAAKVESPEKRYLPAVEFTGKGAERIVVLFTRAPLPMVDVADAAKDAYRRANGNVQQLPNLMLPGEQIHRTVIKP